MRIAMVGWVLLVVIGVDTAVGSVDVAADADNAAVARRPVSRCAVGNVVERVLHRTRMPASSTAEKRPSSRPLLLPNRPLSAVYMPYLLNHCAEAT